MVVLRLYVCVCLCVRQIVCFIRVKVVDLGRKKKRFFRIENDLPLKARRNMKQSIASFVVGMRNDRNKILLIFFLCVFFFVQKNVRWSRLWPVWRARVAGALWNNFAVLRRAIRALFMFCLQTIDYYAAHWFCECRNNGLSTWWLATLEFIMRAATLKHGHWLNTLSGMGATLSLCVSKCWLIYSNSIWMDTRLATMAYRCFWGRR